mmetsp:Transcript_21516/g.24016  ORF Transcript_21516/g.24016 Transcript_21516/m.24016 type:complete len:108 (+) Transcript_21516:258-581(+)
MLQQDTTRSSYSIGRGSSSFSAPPSTQQRRKGARTNRAKCVRYIRTQRDALYIRTQKAAMKPKRQVVVQTRWIHTTKLPPVHVIMKEQSAKKQNTLKLASVNWDTTQ